MKNTYRTDDLDRYLAAQDSSNVGQAIYCYTQMKTHAQILEQELAELKRNPADATHKLKVARESLDAIASWPHSGSNEYRKGEQDPNGYYAHAYYLMESEIDKARDIARIALSLTGPI